MPIDLMDRKQFQVFECAFSDDFLTATYHAWAYSNDMWGDFLVLQCMGGEL